MTTTVEVLAAAFKDSGTPFIVGHPGGVLATLVDLAADWAMVKQTGRAACPPSTCASIIIAPRCRAT